MGNFFFIRKPMTMMKTIVTTMTTKTLKARTKRAVVKKKNPLMRKERRKLIAPWMNPMSFAGMDN